MYPHTSVLLEEVVSHFAETHLNIFIDGTLGAGGHSEAILREHPEIQLLIGIDQDPEAREIAQKRLEPWGDKVKIYPGNFSQLPTILKEFNIASVDGMLLDLGVSSMQLDRPEKGFSFMRDGPLDMRMDPESIPSAEEVVNTWSEQELGRIFREYGEEKQWRAAAKLIVAARKDKPITTTLQLAEALKPAFSYRKKGVHPLTLIFQALRICVNRELEVLETVLPKAIQCLSPKGRLAVITFHSLEDRIVKNILRFAADDKYSSSGIGGVFLDKEPEVLLVTRKPVCADEEEIALNPRSRSAKLRVCEKIGK